MGDDLQISEFWAPLRRTTQARIGLGHTGDGLPTAHRLALREAHALARDAVTTPLDVPSLVEGLADAGVPEAYQVTSRAADRDEYVRRPDLGRLPADLGGLAEAGAGFDVGIVLADGLSPRAVMDHGPAMVAALLDALPGDLTRAPLVIATNARVALGDHVGEALGLGTLLVLIGERPGLSVADSLGLYLTHRPRPGRADSERNCISNIHPPEGLGYRQAAATAVRLLGASRELGRSGVAVKDIGVDRALGAEPAPVPGERTPAAWGVECRLGDTRSGPDEGC